MPTLDMQYHCTVKSIGRAAGRSAVAAAAYRSGTRLKNPRTGETYDYRRRGGVVHAEIITPPGCDGWQDREKLWGAVETAATRRNARLASEVECSLPAALTDAQRLALVRGFAHDLATTGVGVDYAIHSPPRRRPGEANDLPGGSGLNHHVHILVTHHLLTPDGPSKTVSRIADGADAVTALRVRWAEHINSALASAGLTQRQDHRSYRDQGIERIPTRHLGPKTIAMERRGRHTERGTVHRAKQEQRRASIAINALSAEEQRRARVPVPGARESGAPLTAEQRRARAAGYKAHLLRSRYGPLDDLPHFVAQIHSLDLDHVGGPRVRLLDGGTVNDHGDRLTVAGRWRGKGTGREEPSDAAIAAIITLARAKGWTGGIEFTGDHSFKERAARAATRAGLRVSNPDLTHTVKDEQRRMQEEAAVRLVVKSVPTNVPHPATQRPIPLAASAARILADAMRRGDEEATRAGRRTLDDAARKLDDRDRRRVGFRIEDDRHASRAWAESCQSAKAERLARQRLAVNQHPPIMPNFRQEHSVENLCGENDSTPAFARPTPEA